MASCEERGKDDNRETGAGYATVMCKFQPLFHRRNATKATVAAIVELKIIAVLSLAGLITISAAAWNSSMVFDRGYGVSGTSHPKKGHMSFHPKPLSRFRINKRSGGTIRLTVALLSHHVD